MFSATNIAAFLSCHHIMSLEHAKDDGGPKRPHFHDPGLELLRQLGFEHERRYLEELTRDKGHSVVEIDVEATWADAMAETVEALRAGVDVVYQATLLDGNWGGRADFLIRVDTPSSLGIWSYEVADTKL